MPQNKVLLFKKREKDQAATHGRLGGDAGVQRHGGLRSSPSFVDTKSVPNLALVLNYSLQVTHLGSVHRF